MKQDFFSFYYPSEDAFQQLWNDGTIVLDTNVLLDLYRYPQKTSSELLALFKKLQSRLWIPHQVALEYQRNRLNVISDQIRKYQEVRNVIDKHLSEFETALYNLQIRKQHPTIDVDRFISRVRDTFSAFRQELDAQEERQPSIFDEDKIREEIALLFENRIGPIPANQQLLDDIFRAGKTRFEQDRPPGFADASKGKNDDDYYHFGDLTYRRQFGDLILWKQLIEQAKQNTVKSVLFITNDEKADWWETIKFKGERKLGPRRELIEEIRLEAGVELFHIYTSLEFIEQAKSYLGIEITKDSIEQVRNVDDLRRSEMRERQQRIAEIERVVLDWVRSANSGDYFDEKPRDHGYDLTLNMNSGKRTAFHVVYFEAEFSIRHRLRERVYKAYYDIHEHEIDSVVFVCVSSDFDAAVKASVTSHSYLELHDEIRLVFGVVEDDAENGLSFRPITKSQK